MLAAFWSSPGRRCIAAIRGKVTRHFWFDTTEEAEAAAGKLDSEGYNVYFSPSLYDPEKVAQRREEVNPRTGRKYTGREQDNVQSVPALWLDLDTGEGKDYETLQDAAQALQDWVTKHRIPSPTHVVKTGYGLHVYWRLSQPVPPARWLPVAQHLKQACRVGGLAADPARTSDQASLLRVPGTHNHKRGGLAPVEVLASTDNAVDLQAFRASLPMVGPVGAVTTAPVSSEWDVSVKHPPGDAERIASKCGQMGMIRFNRGAVSEPVWRAGLSILHRCEEGERFIHEWSTGDDRYDPAETQAKAEATKGPATCQHFAEVNPEGCSGCPFAGQVTSPIMIALAEELPETEDGETALRTPGYTVTSDGIFMESFTEGAPLTKIADFPVWIEEARELMRAVDGKLDARLVMGWKDSRGEYRKAPLAQTELHDQRQFVAWLASNNLASFVHGPQMAQYISKMHKARFQEKGARVVYESLGWYRDHTMFVVGGMGITLEGVEEVVVDANGPLASLKPQGTLEGWKKAIEPFARPDLRAQAFGVLVGFAAPLMDMIDANGAVVVFSGRSGFGKTLAAQAGMSIYVHPEKTMVSGQSSHGGIAASLAQHRHVPLLVDEVTNMKTYRLRDLIYMAANGSDKTTLTQRREIRQAETWRTVTMLTSNHSLIDESQSEIEEAHRRRLVEIPVLQGVTKAEGKLIGRALAANHGVACGPYLQLLMKHKDKIPALFDLVEAKVEEWGMDGPADRFGTWTCAAALLGGLLAYAAGLLPFDPIPVVKRVVRNTANHNEGIQAPEDQAKDSMFELLTSESKRICQWDLHSKLAIQDVEDPVARLCPKQNVLFVRSSSLRSRWTDDRIYIPALADWLDEVVVSRGKARLSPGTPGVLCYKFNLEKLGWDSNDLMQEEGNDG